MEEREEDEAKEKEVNKMEKTKENWKKTSKLKGVQKRNKKASKKKLGSQGETAMRRRKKMGMRREAITSLAKAIEALIDVIRSQHVLESSYILFFMFVYVFSFFFLFNSRAIFFYFLSNFPFCVFGISM